MSKAFAFWPLASGEDDADPAAAPAPALPPHPGAAEIACLGRVVCISGSQLIVALDKQQQQDTAPQQALRKGCLVRMFGPRSAIYGIVTGLNIPMPAEDAEVALAEIDLVGEVIIDADGQERPFTRGIGAHPALGDFVFATSAKDLQKVYGHAGGGDLVIGALHDDPAQPAMVHSHALLNNHFALLGVTGSGKSCALTVMLRQILAAGSETHILLLDPHNEYSSVFGRQAELVRPTDLQLPFWLLNAEEIAQVILGRKHDPAFAQDVSGILNDLIVQARRSYYRANHPRIADADNFITVDTPIPYSVRDVQRMLDEQMGRLENKANLPTYRWIRARLDILRNDARYGFMFGGFTVRDSMAEIVSRLLRIPAHGKPLTIVDLSHVPSEILNVVVSVLARMSFDFALWSKGAQPLLLICEEAHRYAPADDASGFEPTKQALSRIAKEGRKYGISLGVISQRPAEIEPSTLSQCNTVIAFRMTNLRDQEILRGVVSDAAHGLLDFLPSLGNGDAIMVGLGTNLPMRLRFDTLPEGMRPAGMQIRQGDGISAEDAQSFIADIIDRWRRQAR
ncbi:MAG: DUF87 domain-containing protein [Sphingomonadales bacterium]